MLFFELRSFLSQDVFTAFISSSLLGLYFSPAAFICFSWRATAVAYECGPFVNVFLMRIV